MPVVETNNFGQVRYDEEAVLEFPRGLAGFEARRAFVPLRQPENDPLIFLQSLEEPSLCFVTAPVLVLDADYRLEVDAEDRQLIGLPPGRLKIGEQVLCLAVLSLREDGPTANLLAPVVVNAANRRAVQAVAAASGYSHQHRLCAEEAVACS